MSTPLSQQIVSFYDDELIGVQAGDGTVYAPFSRLCENLGLERVGQVQRVQRHAVLNDALVTLTVATPGGAQEVQCLRIDALPLWLSGLQASRVKPEVREKLIRYQKEAATVLWQAFKPQILVEDAITPARDDAAVAELQQIAEMGRAITRMAEQQIELQRQQQALAQRLDGAARAMRDLRGQVSDVQVRLGVLEDRLSPASVITDAQAAEISNRVKALAELLATRDNSKNHYQSIFGELYRRFSVSSYKLVQQTQYEAVLAFLDEWRTRTAGEQASS